VNFSNFVRQDIDFAAYLQATEAKTMVIPAGLYVDDLVASFGPEHIAAGDQLPWGRFRDDFRLRGKELTVWFGYKGSAKSALLSEVMLSVMQGGRKVLVISPEFTPIEILRRKVRQSGAIVNPTERYARQWSAWANKLLWLFDKQSSLNADLVLGVVAYAIKELGVHHILVDSLMKCGMGVDDYNGQKSFVDRLQHLAHQSTDTHIHLVCHARKGLDDHRPPSLHDAKGASEITDLAENVITIHADKRKRLEATIDDSKPDVLVTIEAQRNHPHLGRYGLWFAKGLRFVGAPTMQPHPYFAMPQEDVKA
jgi:twinkle protein